MKNILLNCFKWDFFGVWAPLDPCDWGNFIYAKFKLLEWLKWISLVYGRHWNPVIGKLCLCEFGLFKWLKWDLFGVWAPLRPVCLMTLLLRKRICLILCYWFVCKWISLVYGRHWVSFLCVNSFRMKENWWRLMTWVINDVCNHDFLERKS